jgi:hypothetical protein
MSEEAVSVSAALPLSVDDIDAQCEEMGRILGLEGPVSEEVLRAAVVNSSYAHNLLVARRDRRFLDRLLDRPPKAAAGQLPSMTELAASAAASLARWARTGFTTVDDQRYRTRLAACAGCPHLLAPPEQRKLLYTLAGARSGTPTVCGKCGCVVAVKARRPHDTCPDSDDANPGFNRWGDRIPPPAP